MHECKNRIRQAVVALVACRDGVPGFLRVSDPARGSAALADLKAALRFLTENSVMFGIHREKITLVGGDDAGVLAAMNLLSPRENDSAVQTYIIQGASPFSPEITKPLGDEYQTLRRILQEYSSPKKVSEGGERSPQLPRRLSRRERLIMISRSPKRSIPQ